MSVGSVQKRTLLPLVGVLRAGINHSLINIAQFKLVFDDDLWVR